MVLEVNDQFLILAFKDQTKISRLSRPKRKKNYGEIIYEMFAFNSTTWEMNHKQPVTN